MKWVPFWTFSRGCSLFRCDHISLFFCLFVFWCKVSYMLKREYPHNEWHISFREAPLCNNWTFEVTRLKLCEWILVNGYGPRIKTSTLPASRIGFQQSPSSTFPTFYISISRSGIFVWNRPTEKQHRRGRRVRKCWLCLQGKKPVQQWQNWNSVKFSSELSTLLAKPHKSSML